MRTALCLVSLAALFAGAGCSTPCYSGKYPPLYDYPAQVLAMPSCRASMEFVSPCTRRFTTERGGTFYIGSPGTDEEIRGFLRTLEEGKSYDFPLAFMEYQKTQKTKPNKAPEATR